MTIKVLFFGDVVGKIGRNAFLSNLPILKEKHNANLIIVNGENSANGRGITSKIVKEYLNSGVDCITSGNHIFDNKEILHHIDDFPQLIRPENYPPGTPGNSFYIFNVNGIEIAIINTAGQIFMPPFDNPFHAVDRLIESELKNIPVKIIDFHAEATSEKQAFFHYFSGKVSAILGTHTHVQTNDAGLIDNYTACITDVGMVGAKNSIIGMDKDITIEKFVTLIPNRLNPPTDKQTVQIDYAIMEINLSGKGLSIKAESILA